ncbi:MAG: mechanosensitive ion channel domain-containing protein [Candidatus Hodarchaeales archaeon]
MNQDIWKVLTDFSAAYNPIILQITTVLLIVFFLWIVWRLFLNKIKDNISPELHNALNTIGRVIIVLLGIFGIVGEEFFIGAAALLGTAIGFASSTTIGNFISGLYLLVTNPFSVGDYVMLPGMKIEGIVEEISINYTKILSPQGIHISVSNQKLLGTAIHNTSITVPKEAVIKGKITWRDHEGDQFDSIDDVVDIMKGLRAKFADKTVDYYLYPLIYNLNPDKYKHSLTKQVLDETVKRFSERTAEEITWFLNDRSNYQLNLIVENPYSIFDLKNDILGFLEEEVEKIHEI